MRIALYKFNNYYNRKLKKKDTYLQYAPYMLPGGTNPVQDVNFKPDDNIDTQQKINWNGDIPDYLIAYEDDYNIRLEKFSQRMPLSDHIGGTIVNQGLTITPSVSEPGKYTVSGTAEGSDPIYLTTSAFRLTTGIYYVCAACSDANARIALYRSSTAVINPPLGFVIDMYGHDIVQRNISATDAAGYYYIMAFVPTLGQTYDNVVFYPQLFNVMEIYPSVPSVEEFVKDFPDVLKDGKGYSYEPGTTNYIKGSRWFVMDAVRIRAQQWLLTLHRDVLADNHELVMTSPAFIEKGYVPDTDSAVFNKEDITVNQIKTAEALIKDITGTPWIVGYLDSEAAQSTETVTIDPQNVIADVTVTSLESWNWFSKLTGKYSRADYGTGTIYQQDYILFVPYWKQITGIPGDKIQTYKETYESYLDTEDAEELQQMQGQILYASDTGKYWQIIVRTSPATGEYNPVEPMSELGIFVRNRTGSNEAIKLTDMHGEYSIELRLLSTAGASITMSKDRLHLSDAPYDMFCIPYGDVTVLETGEADWHTSANMAFRAGMAIARKYKSAGRLFDLQILPYCPLPKAYQDDTAVLINSADEGERYNFITDDDTEKASIIFWLENSTFNLTVPFTYEVEDVKLSNETEKIRLCSPNYAGAFEMSPAKNGGIAFIDIDCTYLPQVPYIHLAPNFGRLYGSDFNDNRGLICGGDWSLPAVIDSWLQYQANNKNYQLSFDREIQNMEFNQKMQRKEEMINMVAGTVGAAGMGVLGGLQTAGPAGAVIGGTAGAAGGIVAAALDWQLNEARRRETIDYRRDQFGYNLQNIAALPNTLAKVTAFTANNKIFPFVELYKPTEEEIEAVRNKIKYNGMTIMRIGRPVDYLNGSEEVYIKAKVIRLDDLSDDAHMATVIAEELNKGVYTNVSASI